MNELTFSVPGEPKSLNAISNASHWERSAEEKYWRETAVWALKANRGARFDIPVDIEFTVYGPGRLKDHISPAVAIKGITDGLCDAKVIANDAPRFVNRIILNCPRKSPKPSVLVTVTTAADRSNGAS
jgi:hypothetical protein